MELKDLVYFLSYHFVASASGATKAAADAIPITSLDKPDRTGLKLYPKIIVARLQAPIDIVSNFFGPYRSQRMPIGICIDM